MKFSELWLREWINITSDSAELSDQITMAGFEVNSIEPVAGMFRGVVIGKIVKCSKHTDIDNLWITKIDIGSKRLLNIICGAINCRQRLKVAVATVDTILPENFKIKITKLGGKISEGMLCSYSELGIPSDNNDIIELPDDAPIGIDIRDYLKLDDNIIKINVTPNRTDCLSMIGIARDLALLNKARLNMPDIAPVAATINDSLPVHIGVTDICPRYLGRIIKGINIKVLTPLWIKEKLRRCGIDSINIVADIINYVFLELGQPMHIFDKNRIDGGIIIRMAKKGETLILLDGSRVKLSTETLVINDYCKTLIMGNVLSNDYSSINGETQNVLLECAFFSLLSIIGSTRHYNLHINSSYYCYERSMDPTLQYKAIDRATSLLVDICGGDVGPIIEITNEETLPKRATIILRRSKLDRVIGYHIDDEQISDIMHRLGCDVTEGQYCWQIIVPSWRFDIEIEEDLIEEVVRIYGYNNIPSNPVQASLIMSKHYEANLSLKRVKTLLNDRGYQEVITYSFVDPKLQQLIHPDEEALVLPKPVSNEMSVMRLSLWTSLLKIIIYNQNRQQTRVRIFETGLRFVPDTKASLNIRQDMMLAGAIYGNRYEEHWDLEKVTADFYDVKGDIESVFNLTGKLSEIEFRTEVIPALHPGQSAAIYLEKERIGFIGIIHPELERKLDLNNNTILFEIEWNKIANRVIPQAKDIPRFPANNRDISIVVTENVLIADILTECKKINLNQIISVNLFDIYRGKDLPKGFKSLTIRLTLQDADHTLEEEETTAIVTQCIEALKKRFQVSLRD